MNNKSFFSLGIFVLMMSLMYSCKKDEVDLSENQNTKNNISFKGLPVNHHYKAPLEALSYQDEDFEEMLQKGLANKARRGQSTNMSLAELANLEEENLIKYPDFDELADKDIEMIKLDFPDLTEKEIAENMDIISEYYTRNLQYELALDVIDYQANNNENQFSDYYYGLCDREIKFLVTRPTAASEINKATNDARSYTETYADGRDDYQTRPDAFRHCLWNILIAKYYGTRKKSKYKGVTMARDFTNLHEKCSEDDGHDQYDIEMDLHNNYVGRDYFDDVAELKTKRRRFWFTKKWLETPSNEDIVHEIGIKAEYESVRVETSVTAVKKVSSKKLVYFFNG